MISRSAGDGDCRWALHCRRCGMDRIEEVPVIGRAICNPVPLLSQPCLRLCSASAPAFASELRICRARRRRSGTAHRGTESSHLSASDAAISRRRVRISGNSVLSDRSGTHIRAPSLAACRRCQRRERPCPLARPSSVLLLAPIVHCDLRVVGQSAAPTSSAQPSPLLRAPASLTLSLDHRCASHVYPSAYSRATRVRQTMHSSLTAQLHAIGRIVRRAPRAPAQSPRRHRRARLSRRHLPFATGRRNSLVALGAR